MIQFLNENYVAIFAIIGQVVTVASAIVALTPSTKDDEIVGKIASFISRFSVFNKKSK
jgi:hypothetical protein